MSRYAVVDNQGNVTNVVVVDQGSDWSEPDGRSIIASDEASKGGTLIDGVYTPPENLDDQEEQE